MVGQVDPVYRRARPQRLHLRGVLSQAAQPAPLSYAECYLQVDLWSNEHIRSDPHYTQADGASEFMSHHQARARQIEENIKIIDVKWRLFSKFAVRLANPQNITIPDCGHRRGLHEEHVSSGNICPTPLPLSPSPPLRQVGAPRHREQAGRRAAQDVHG